MKYIRPSHDMKYYLLFLFVYVSSIVYFGGQAFLEKENMINNGYVNKDAISFTLNGENIALDKNNTDFILLQYDPSNPEYKYVMVNGDVSFPPITKTKKINIEENDYIAIAGKDFNRRTLPPEYTLTGYFNTPNAHKLNSEVWLFNTSNKVDFERGNMFILNTPSNNPMNVLNNMFDEDLIQIIDHERGGTYALNSNKVFIFIIYLFLLFLIAIYFATIFIWLSKENNLIAILYLHGNTTYSIYGLFIKYKIAPHVIMILFLITATVLSEKLYPFWSDRWLLYIILLLIAFIIYLFLISFALIYAHSKKKGGKRF